MSTNRPSECSFIDAIVAQDATVSLADRLVLRDAENRCAPTAEAMANCQKGTLVDAIAMLSRFHGTMGLNRSSRMIFQPSTSCTQKMQAQFRLLPVGCRSKTSLRTAGFLAQWYSAAATRPQSWSSSILHS